jgi:hypothetical protein
MKLRHVAVMVNLLMVFLISSLVLIRPSAWCGSLRINMTDGSFIEVPYFWEEGGEVKFEFAGGVAGILRSQVTSIQEVLAAKEFDPEVLLETPKEAPVLENQKKLRDFFANQIPSLPGYEKLDLDQSLQILQSESMGRKGAGTPNEVLYGPLFNLEANSAQLVRIRGNGVLLVMQNLLSSRADLRNRAFTLIAYSGEGTVLQRKPCEINEITIDRKTQIKLEVSGYLFSVTATITPDPRIKRFEIVTARR